MSKGSISTRSQSSRIVSPGNTCGENVQGTSEVRWGFGGGNGGWTRRTSARLEIGPRDGRKTHLAGARIPRSGREHTSTTRGFAGVSAFPSDLGGEFPRLREMSPLCSFLTQTWSTTGKRAERQRGRGEEVSTPQRVRSRGEMRARHLARATRARRKLERQTRDRAKQMSSSRESTTQRSRALASDAPPARSAR